MPTPESHSTTSSHSSNMESFGFLLLAMGVSAPDLDFVADLPPEVSQRIFGYLDAGSLVKASRVSRRWVEVCRGDPNLRRRARRHFRRALQGEIRAAPRRLPKQPGRIGDTRHPSFKLVQAPIMANSKRTIVSRVNRTPKAGSTTRNRLRI